jgi:hypothetical protein
VEVEFSDDDEEEEEGDDDDEGIAGFAGFAGFDDVSASPSASPEVEESPSKKRALEDADATAASKRQFIDTVAPIPVHPYSEYPSLPLSPSHPLLPLFLFALSLPSLTHRALARAGLSPSLERF